MLEKLVQAGRESCGLGRCGMCSWAQHHGSFLSVLCHDICVMGKIKHLLESYTIKHLPCRGGRGAAAAAAAAAELGGLERLWNGGAESFQEANAMCGRMKREDGKDNARRVAMCCEYYSPLLFS